MPVKFLDLERTFLHRSLPAADAIALPVPPAGKQPYLAIYQIEFFPHADAGRPRLRRRAKHKVGRKFS